MAFCALRLDICRCSSSKAPCTLVIGEPSLPLCIINIFCFVRGEDDGIEAEDEEAGCVGDSAALDPLGERCTLDPLKTTGVNEASYQLLIMMMMLMMLMIPTLYSPPRAHNDGVPFRGGCRNDGRSGSDVRWSVPISALAPPIECPPQLEKKSTK